MKRAFGVVLMACLMALTAKAQLPAPARLHFLNPLHGERVAINMTGNGKPMLIKARTWGFVQPAGDSLGLVIGDKPYFIHVERGKQYYFIFQTSQGARPVLTEKSEREFLLTAGSFSNVVGPTEYLLNKTQ